MAMSLDERSVYKSSVENPSFMKRQQCVIAGYAVADTPRILSASSCAFGTNKPALRPSKDGRSTDPGFTRDRHQICASRVNPTCDVQDAARGCDI
jgi:hypothetical protein